MGPAAWPSSPMTVGRLAQCLELVQWLYAVARHRVRRLGAPTSARGDLVQGMSSIFTLENKRHELSEHGNPRQHWKSWLCTLPARHITTI
jgi:hypothetical protein